ncbi:MAG: ComF family protein [Emcibacter sp.]|nr:ComF family protein [Emcibacter sp.]
MSKSNLKQHMTRWATRLLDQFLPPRCLSCGSGAQDAGRICPTCWKELEFLQGAACDCCGFPFPFDQVLEGALCGTCQADPPAFDRARAAVRYDDGSRRMIISFKHGDRTDYADFFAQLLFLASYALDVSEAIVIPVPLHKKRLRKRRYNQAALMGQAFARKKQMAYIPDMLLREKYTPPQEGDNHDRQRNVAGAFKVNDKHLAVLSGRMIILVDDVYTTGATVGACAQILKRAGAKGVKIVTVARVCS